MDLETVQLLNLSPIPELSEVELSTMLEQLSGLSDFNGDLTDRNVEDIIKEAEDLLDKSKSTDIISSISKNGVEAKEDKLAITGKDVDDLKDIEGLDFQQKSSKETTHKSPVKADHQTPCSSANEDGCTKKHFNSPAETTPTKSQSPGGSSNVIKLTIDSLNEFSLAAEKKLTDSSNSSARKKKSSKPNEKGAQNKENSHVNEKLSSPRQVKTPKIKTPKANTPKANTPKANTPKATTPRTADSSKKSSLEAFDKSKKTSSCFERLYKDRPIRLAPSKKPKPTNKIPKVVGKKKITKDLKSIIKNNIETKTDKGVNVSESIKSLVNKNDQTLTENHLIQTDPFNQDKEKDIFFNSVFNPMVESEKKIIKSVASEEDEVQHCHLRYLPVCQFQDEHLKPITSSVDEQLILRVLEEMEEIKDQVRKVGAFNDAQNRAVIMRGKLAYFDDHEAQAASVVRNLQPTKNAEIKRLEEQVYTLKEKYEHQMEKLEAENFRLREALSVKYTPPQYVYPEVVQEPIPVEQKIPKPLDFPKTSKECVVEYKTPESSPAPSPPLALPPPPAPPPPPLPPPQIISKESSSQTERTNVRTTSSQCFQEVASARKKEYAEEETRETENKENLIARKKTGKWKPFSDMNIHHLLKQKKTFDHESELLITVRGLQTEINNKEKENRKLRSQADSLRRQMNRWTNLKGDTCRRCHIGTQTIGLGPAVQKPYNPESYEAAGDLRKENEELRLKIKTFEEDFEVLKEKRVNDLQALHQVHEEEMAKLVSKLETQSALTKHLHTLLVNR